MASIVLLGDDEAVTHSFRVSAFVFNRQCISEVATILNHSFSGGGQLFAQLLPT
jgi:hypothetical protein